MSALLDHCEATLGRGLARLAAAACALGALALAGALTLGQGGPALGTLGASWLFCAGLAAGGVALSAAIRLAQGRWAGTLLPAAEALAGFSLPAFVLLAILILGARLWIPSASGAGPGELAWLAGRELGASALLFFAGRAYLDRVRSGAPIGAAAVRYLLLYAATLSFWAFDFVIALRDWTSTVLPALYFMGALLSALAFALLASLLRSPSRLDADARHDAGKLLFALSTFWAYLVWSAFLPTWYANLPEETRPLLDRFEGTWRPVMLATLFAVFVFPFGLLLLESAKRNARLLAIGAGSVVTGLFLERLLLVLPSLALPASPLSLALGALIAAGTLGLLLLGFGNALATAAPGSRAPEAGAAGAPGHVVPGG